MNQISKSFGSVFGSGVSAKQGIVQDLNRNSMLGALSHIRRLITPLAAGSKTIGPRKLHGVSMGVCLSYRITGWWKCWYSESFKYYKHYII